MNAVGPWEPVGTAQYRREARRLRARLDGGALYRSLADLSRQRDAAGVARAGGAGGDDHDDERRLASPDGLARRFAEQVLASLDGPVLRYARRQELLRQAERLGIGRFEANLLIAAVLHRRPRWQRGDPGRPGGGRWARARRWAGPLLMVLALQAAILAGAWHLLLAP